jgi:hypothetical protein
MNIDKAKKIINEQEEAKRVIAEQEAQERRDAITARVQEFDTLLRDGQFPRARILAHELTTKNGRNFIHELERAETEAVRASVLPGKLVLVLDKNRTVGIDLGLSYLHGKDLIIAGTDTTTGKHVFSVLPLSSLSTNSPLSSVLAIVRGG